MKITANVYFLFANPAGLAVLHSLFVLLFAGNCEHEGAFCCCNLNWCKLIPNPDAAIQMNGFDLISLVLRAEIAG